MVESEGSVNNEDIGGDASESMKDVTCILNAIKQGDADSIDALLPAVYDELRWLAARKISHEKPGHTLQATALVHEAYLRLMGSDQQGFASRTYFFGAAAEAMRRILIDHARRKHAQKRGGGWDRREVTEEDIVIDDCPDDLIALDDALEILAEEEPEKAELVKLRYFAGLTIEQAAGIMNISTTTAKRYWDYARAWLYGRIQAKD